MEENMFKFTIVIALFCYQNVLANNRIECQDLFKASCLNENGENKFDGVLNSIEDQAKRYIFSLMDKIAEQRGHDNHIHYVRSELEKVGIALPEAIRHHDMKEGLYQLRTYFHLSAMEFPIYDKISDLALSIRNIPYNEDNLSNEDLLLKIKNKFHSLETLMRPFYLKNRRLFGLFIIDQCKLLSDDIIPDLCTRNKTNELRTRLIKAPDDALFNQTWSDYKYIFFGAHHFNNPNLSISERIQRLMRINPNSIYLEHLSVFKDKLLTINDSVLRTKIFHNGMREYFYPKKLKEELLNKFQQQKEIIANYLTANINHPNIGLAVSSLSTLEFAWPNEFTSEYYLIEEESGLEVFNKKKLVENPSLRLFYLDRFGSRMPDFFLRNNAYYEHHTSLGAWSLNSEKITILPLNLKVYQSSPMAVLNTMAHEIGHRFDTLGSATNGFSLGSIYHGLISCLERPQSILLAQGQENEAVSDFIGSIIIGNLVSDLDQKQRVEKIKESQHIHCLYETLPNTRRFDLLHPLSEFRVSGISGASPAIRESLSCQVPSSKYITCGLEGEEL